MLLVAAVVPANATTINFDSLAGGPIPSGAFPGVTFLNATVVSSGFELSAPNGIISTSGGFDWLEADAITVQFSGGATSATITGLNVGFNGLRMNAYDSGGGLLGFVQGLGTTEGGTASPNPPGDIVTLSLSFSNISYVTIFQVTGQYPDTIVLDDFTYTAVPEPSTWLLLGTGLAAVATRRRFAKRK